jgi:pyruvate dehydrogenase (quinone)
MAATVADEAWEMLAGAGVRRCYGIVGDALNPMVDALRRNGSIELIHVRHEEWGVFAAVADASLTGQPVAVCGTAGPGTAHLINGLIDAKKEGAPVIAIAGDVETSIIDTDALEELNPYTFFASAALYIGRIVNPKQVHNVVGTAITTAIAERGPTVIAVPVDVARAEAPHREHLVPIPATTIGAASAADLTAIAAMVNEGSNTTIFGGDGCRDAEAETRALAQKLKAPVGYSFKGKQWLEHDNPNAVGMNGLLGYGGCWDAVNHADVLLMLGTDFPLLRVPSSKRRQDNSG